MQNISVDDIVRYLCRYYGNCGHDTTKLWILSALIKLLPHANMLQELVETLTTSYNSTNQEIVQVTNIFLVMSCWLWSIAYFVLHVVSRVTE